MAFGQTEYEIRSAVSSASSRRPTSRPTSFCHQHLAFGLAFLSLSSNQGGRHLLVLLSRVQTDRTDFQHVFESLRWASRSKRPRYHSGGCPPGCRFYKYGEFRGSSSACEFLPPFPSKRSLTSDGTSKSRPWLIPPLPRETRRTR